jgi:hypothetical protein
VGCAHRVPRSMPATLTRWAESKDARIGCGCDARIGHAFGHAGDA